MEDLLAFIGTYINNEGRAQMVFVLLVTFTFFGFGMAIALVIMGVSDPLRRRLVTLTGANRGANTTSAKIARALQPVSEYILPSAEKERSHVRAQLIHAGFRAPNAITIYYATKTAFSIALPAVVLLSAPFFPSITTGQVVFYAIMAAGVGVIAPNVVVRHVVEKRKKLLRDGFPDALDLLVVCVESGLGLAAAIQRVADELSVSHPELAEELMIVNSEIRAGVERTTALKNLAVRTGLDDIRGLVTLLSQSMRFGTSIADTLRVYAEEFRDKRMQRAEELAAKVGTKLIFPLVLCLFPSFFVVAIGPAILKVLEAVSRI